MNQYKPRIVDSILQEKLASKGAVVIEGPKWCGKTTTAKQHSKSVIYMDNPAEEEQYKQLLSINPSRLLGQEPPLLIDEWQLAPKVWDVVRFEVDQRGEFGQFILTGSAVPVETDVIHHSGTGRFTWLMMRPMSLFESRESSGEVRLASLFEGDVKIDGTNPLDFDRLAFVTCRGGWPQSVGRTDKIALLQAYDYVEALIHADLTRVDGIKRNPKRVQRLLQSYARNQGTSANYGVIYSDIKTNDDSSLSTASIASYILALKKMFVVEDMTTWNPNLRSKTAVRSADTRYFVDPSIAAAALNLSPKDLANDLHSFGFLFETLCVRDLRVYAQALGGTVYHYRDRNGLECDAIIHLPNGSYGLVEIKLGGAEAIESAARALCKLESIIDLEKMKPPSFKMVLVGVGEYAYVRSDGIFVVPVGCLRD